MSELQFLPPVLVKTSDAGILAGYASTFGGMPDAFGDVVSTTAFSKSLERHQMQGSRPALLWQHDQAFPLGVISALNTDDHGLFVRAKLVLSAEKAAQAYDLAKAGGLAFSIGYRTVKETQKSDHTLLEEIDLKEISLVSVPANSAAQIIEVKSALTIRDFEQHIKKQFNLSTREARRLATSGWRAFRPDDMTAIADYIRASTKLFRS